ncbi:hypothetical protein AX15_007612 [Amanita polypyramis BW_CC]|nr:hypothetical protein AX15_007612 [Amanita polypyramis BW_CC]
MASEASHPALSFTNPYAPSPEAAGAGTRFPKRNSQKQRPLIIVVPPIIPLHHHGQQGRTFSFGPPQRLSQGTVMPLYPTMYAQLTAIAREFNFPTTAGLCLYLRYPENGVTLTPRISDESWHSLWNFAFESSLPSSRILHISGTIELDVDPHQARWYPSWVSSTVRDFFDSSFPAHPYTAAPESHRRGDSQITIYDEHASPYSRQPAVPTPLRELFPRKLSLVERFEVGNTKTLLQPTSASPERPALIQTLPPIAQESDPSMARQELNTRIESWRGNASPKSTPLAETGQHSLEPFNIPNTMQINVSPGASETLKQEEYAWPITSAGPDDHDSVPPANSEHLPSIYLEHKLTSSVCPTPSVCTSFGPFDHGSDFPIEGLCDLPSPDLAHRAIGSVPLTPVTATTWGPPSSFPPSPSSMSYAASVDIGCRHILSPPLSISTATSWGPPLSDPHSPVVFSVPSTPDIGIRVFDDIDTAVFWYDSCSSDSQGGGKLLDVERFSQPGNNHHSYPYLNIYPAVYPFFDLYPAEARENTFVSTLSVDQTSTNHPISVTLSQYPSFNLYPPDYPFFDLYPGMLQLAPLSIHHESSEILATARSYPMLNLYPPVYPHLEIYPTTIKSIEYPQRQSPVTSESKLLSIHSRPYPIFDLYPAAYPYFNLYPPVAQPNPSPIDNISSLDPLCPRNYPTLTIYSSAYPHSDTHSSHLYANIDLPTSQVTPCPKPVDVRLNPTYPIIVIYPSVYPYLNIYPIISLTNDRLPPSFELFKCLTVASPTTKSQMYLRPRYTHVQLREQVLKERVLEYGRKKSHCDLHYSVFPTGLVATPSGTTHLQVESQPQSEPTIPTQLSTTTHDHDNATTLKSVLRQVPK